MRKIFILIAIILVGCSVYHEPYNVRKNYIDLIEVYSTDDNSIMRSITDKDSINTLVKYINFNQGIEDKFEFEYRINLINTKDKDTSKLDISMSGQKISTDEPVKNLSGKVLSAERRYFKLSMSLNGYLFAK